MFLHDDERATPPSARTSTWPLLPTALQDEARGLANRALPATALYEPTLLAAAVRAPIFLRRGLWPVNLLAAPDIVRFCEWLPAPWRADRRLHRERLVRAGLPSARTRPAVRENFTDVMAYGLHRHALPRLERLMADPILAQLGLIDPDAVRAEGKRVDAGSAPVRGLYEIIALELALRALAN